ncbi:AfsR/SARP family transcriptional regulator [Streptomyces sp. NPDC050085]|uniref:AfsR/SARP family transcriptional regulator n=1 Tax=Streptomyces sp. NPDC050085 TaxID=3365600 RepID=UPI0037A3DD18
MVVRLCLFGPVEVLVPGRSLDVGPPQRRTVLAALAVDAGRPVPVATLLERVWGGAPPDGARRSLYAHLARIRRLTGQADGSAEAVGKGADAGRLPVLRRSGGYQLDLAPDAVDLLRFRALAGRSRERTLPDSERVALLREALVLWRGEPLSGLHGTWPDRVREAWRRERVDSAVRLADLEVRGGEPATAIGRLTELLEEYPLTEPLTEVLMRALHATGDGAEALRCFARIRRRLVDELGTEPGPKLRELHELILKDSPRTAAARPRPPVVEAAPVAAAPAQLPMGVHGFVGRAHELTRLDGLLAGLRESSSGGVVAVISGAAGVGKTALAVHWARRARAAFPDGQLYVNLRGFDPGGAPLVPDRALRGFLDALGVPAGQVPDTLEALTGRYRSLLAGRRVLVVLDNARDAGQVRPLLPGAHGCLTVVTSRDPLTGLAVSEGAHLLTPGLLDPAQCRALLAVRLGAPRLQGAPEAVEEIVARCAGLPLALAVVAARAAARPDLDLADCARELGPDGRILDVLDTGDPATGVRAVLHWSYRMLTPEAGRLFRLFALHPGPSADATALAALAGTGVRTVQVLLREVAAAHLLTEQPAGRHSCHDLLRAYATELAAADDDRAGAAAATRRVLDHYLHTAHAADALLTRRCDPMELGPAAPGALVRQPADYEEALGWFTAEHPVLLSAIERTPPGCDAYTWQLAATLTTYLERQGHWQALTDAHTTALRTALAHDDAAGQASAHRGLGLALLQRHDARRARRHLTRALELYRRLGNHAGQARARQNLAKMAWTHGAAQEALGHSYQALQQFRAAEDGGGQAVTLNDIGWYLAELGRFQEAFTYCRRALPLVQDVGDLSAEAHTWDSLAHIHRRLGRYERAVECYDRALALFRRAGERRSEAVGLAYLGDTHAEAGHTGRAHDAWRRSLALTTELGLPDAHDLRSKLRVRAGWAHSVQGSVQGSAQGDGSGASPYDLQTP